MLLSPWFDSCTATFVIACDTSLPLDLCREICSIIGEMLLVLFAICCINWDNDCDTTP